MKKWLWIFFLLPLSACNSSASDGRWYTTAQLETGKVLFARHCAACHGEQAQGLAKNWRKKDADGFYPPPPLNGTAHAWHHPLPTLQHVIQQGGVAQGGRMPRFSGKLSEQEQLAVIAWFQHYWLDDVYRQWMQRQTVNAQGGTP